MREAHAKGQPFDAALLDYQMPDCDGAELGRRIVADAAAESDSSDPADLLRSA